MSQLFQSPFGRHSSAWEVIDGVDLSGKRAIVTGPTPASASKPHGPWPPLARKSP
jgi:hypothetical protein